MTKRPHMSAGFTLIELLVVLGIVGLTLAAVVGARPRTTAVRLSVTARAIAATLQMARAQAISSSNETVFRIDTKARQFGVGRVMHALPQDMAVAITIADTERVQDSGGVRFYPDGQSSGGEIVLSLDGRKSRIGVNWLTGEPRLSP
jgi:general secretion pathway protein H